MITLIGKKRIGYINQAFLGHHGATDVITFDYRSDGSPAEGDSEEATVIGDILVCPEVAAEAATVAGTSVGYEVVLYAIHGMLHLAGYDDHEVADVAAMREAESSIMNDLCHHYNLDSIF